MKTIKERIQESFINEGKSNISPKGKKLLSDLNKKLSDVFIKFSESNVSIVSGVVEINMPPLFSKDYKMKMWYVNEGSHNNTKYKKTEGFMISENVSGNSVVWTPPIANLDSIRKIFLTKLQDFFSEG